MLHSAPIRTRIEPLTAMRERLLRANLAEEMTCAKAAELLGISRKQFQHLKARYLRHGVDGILPRKPGPKQGRCANRTPDVLQDLVCQLATRELALGPVGLAATLEVESGARLHPVTVWRILKRRKIRYTSGYRRWKADPKLYCLETPGQEVQLDACFPYGKARRLVSIDCIDDCSRYADGELFANDGGDVSAIAALQAIVARAPFRIQCIRVDNGFGKRFVAACHALGIRVRFNDAYHPEQNGKVERFHKTLKHEGFFRTCTPDMELSELQYRYRLFLDLYNTKRRHTGLGMDGRTPAQKHCWI